MGKNIYSLIWAGVLCAGVTGQLGCQETQGPTPGDVSEGEAPATETVTVTGEFERRIDDRTFTMSGDAEFFKDNLAVVSRTELPAMMEGDEIEVTGTVQHVALIEVEREIGWDFDPQIEVELEDRKGFLVADSVRVLTDERMISSSGPTGKYPPGLVANSAR